jgi:hypothetical protein
MFRRLVIGNGVEPGRCTATIVEMVWVPDNPARGKAQGRITPPAKRALARWTADGNRSPEVDAISIPGRSLFADPCDYQRAIGHPDENQSGRKQRHERHVGPDGQKCRRDEHNGVLQKRASR